MKRRAFVSLLGGAVLVPFVARDGHGGQTDGCDGRPVARDDGWSVGATDDKRVDGDALCGICDRLTAGNANIHAVLVVRGGRLVFERYFKGPEEVPGRFYGKRVETISFDPDTLHNMKSVSKSVASLAFGIAVDRGLIRSLDEPVFDFFPELSDLRSPEKDKIRLSHMLTMSMGLDWVEATPATGDDDNDEARMNRASDPCRYVLGRPVISSAGEKFFYNTGALRLVSAIIHKATGLPLDEFARTTLFAPLGITSADWARIKGYTDSGGGLHLRPRDMAKIGQLVLAGGSWNDRQIVSRAWIEASTTSKFKATGDLSYGYLWWLGRTRPGQRDIPWIGALGRGGQSIRILPELDLVVVVTAGYYEDYSREAFQLQYNVFKDVVRVMATAN